jgi:hypothetical protein
MRTGLSATPGYRYARGVEVLDDHDGSGPAAARGDQVFYNLRIWLNRGDEVPINEHQAPHLPAAMVRRDGDRVLIDHTILLGRRRAAAGIEQALVGMRPGGHRRVRVDPHLAYGARGIPGLIPPHAVLVIALWVRAVTPDPIGGADRR